jgi:hypothetical protein
MVGHLRGFGCSVATIASLFAALACDQAAPTNPAETLQKLNDGLLQTGESQLDGILDGLEGRDYSLVFRRRDAVDTAAAGGLDPAASNLHLQLLGHAPGATTITDATAPVPRLCAELTTIIQNLGDAIAPTPLGRGFVALGVCTGLDRSIAGLLAAGGDLDRFLEKEVAPHMRGTRSGGECKGYTIAAATLDFRVQGVDLTPNASETRLTMRIEDPTLRVTEGTYQVAEGSEPDSDGKGKQKVCVDRSLVGARLAIDGRLDLDFRVRASERTDPFPWLTACGKQIVAYMPPPAEAATIPRNLAHGHLAVELGTRAEITKIELDSQGLFVDWAVQYFMNHTKRIRCAFAGVSKEQCERSTEAVRTISVADYETILPTRYLSTILRHGRD